MAAGLAGSPLLLIAAYRPAEASGELDQALAALARRSPVRLPLAGLPAPDAAALVSSAAFAAWTEPTPWQTRPYGVVDERAVAILERQLERTSPDQATRCRLLAALVAELAGEGDPRPARAAAEAEAIARTAAAVLGRPEELRRRLDSGRRLAGEYRMAEPQAATR